MAADIRIHSTHMVLFSSKYRLLKPFFRQLFQIHCVNHCNKPLFSFLILLEFKKEDENLYFHWLSSLQDIRLLNAGKPAQHTAELETELDKADNMIRLLFNDVQILKDGRHPQAEEMYRRWVRLVLHSSELLTLLRKQFWIQKKAAVKSTVFLISTGFTASMSAW